MRAADRRDEGGLVMAIARWDPWQEINTLERQFDDLLGRVRRREGGGSSGGSWMPSIDVHQEEGDYVIRAELAGVAPENVELTVQEGILRLSGTREDDTSVSEDNWIRRERFTGRFERDI